MASSYISQLRSYDAAMHDYKKNGPRGNVEYFELPTLPEPPTNLSQKDKADLKAYEADMLEYVRAPREKNFRGPTAPALPDVQDTNTNQRTAPRNQAPRNQETGERVIQEPRQTGRIENNPEPVQQRISEPAVSQPSSQMNRVAPDAPPQSSGPLPLQRQMLENASATGQFQVTGPYAGEASRMFLGLMANPDMYQDFSNRFANGGRLFIQTQDSGAPISSNQGRSKVNAINGDSILLDWGDRAIAGPHGMLYVLAHEANHLRGMTHNATQDKAYMDQQSLQDTQIAAAALNSLYRIS
jgi:hypothetical protein